MASEADLIQRAIASPIRFKIFVALGLLLLVLGLTGAFNVSRDVDIERQEAVEIARPEIDFEPVNADARLVRQGVGVRTVWAVSFSIPAADGSRDDFDRLTTVEVDARTGDIIKISRDQPLANASGG